MKITMISASADYNLSGHYGYSGRKVRKYDMAGVLSSPTHRALSKYDKKKLIEDDFWRSRNAALIDSKCKAGLNKTYRNAIDGPLPCFSNSCK